MALKNNTWKLNQWYDQNVSGNVDYSGATETWVTGAGGMVAKVTIQIIHHQFKFLVLHGVDLPHLLI